MKSIVDLSLKWHSFMMILIMKYLISHFLEIFLSPLPMVYDIFRSMFVLLEYAIMLMTSTTETPF